MNAVKTRANFIGCYRTTRRCFHCGYEMEFIVLEGRELTEPNVTDYCAGADFHEKAIEMEMPPLMRDAFFFDKRIRISTSILKPKR